MARGAFFGKRACNVTWVTGQGVLGTTRVLMLVAKVGERTGVAGVVAAPRLHQGTGHMQRPRGGASEKGHGKGVT